MTKNDGQFFGLEFRYAISVSGFATSFVGAWQTTEIQPYQSTSHTRLLGHLQSWIAHTHAVRK